MALKWWEREMIMAIRRWLHRKRDPHATCEACVSRRRLAQAALLGMRAAEMQSIARDKMLGDPFVHAAIHGARDDA